ncbi:MAG: SprT family zinc-dependent metalloprotease [Pseudomonadota bacterium]
MSVLGQLDLFPQGQHQSRFVVRESGRAKRLSIHVAAHGDVEVVVPRHTSPARISAFVESNRNWIDKTLAAFAEQYDAEEFSLPQRIELAAIGQNYDVQYRNTKTNNMGLKTYGSTLILSGDVANTDRCRQVLKDWLRSLGKQHLIPWIKQVADDVDLKFRRVQVRGQRTRWGSCSSQATISLNWGLLFCTPDLVRYLFVHELCHTVHLNHSKRFWALVKRFEPDYRALDRRLDDSWRSVPGWARI